MNKPNPIFSLSLFFLITLCLVSCNASSHQKPFESSSTIEPESLLDTSCSSDAPDLDQLLSDFEFPPISTDGITLSPEENLNGLPPELAMQFAKTVYTEQSVSLIQEMNQADLMITPQDFVFDPISDDDYAPYAQDLWKSLHSDDPRLDLYQVDLDNDGTNEIIAITKQKYDYSHSNTAYLLRKTGKQYILAGYDYLGYYRCCSIFLYEGTYYLAANYDDYEAKTTKAVGLFALNGDESGFMWLIHKPHTYLLKTSEDYKYHLLYANETDPLTASIQAYIDEIATDLVYTARIQQTFYGTASSIPCDEWNPDGYGQDQNWFHKIEGTTVMLTLFRKEESDLFLLDARIRPENETVVLLDYIIRPEPLVKASDYWDYDDSNLIHNRYEDPGFDLAFPDSLPDEAERFALAVQGDYIPEDYNDAVIPSELVTAAQKALFDRTPHEPDLIYSSPEIESDRFYSSFLFEKNDYDDRTAEHIYKYHLEQDDYYLFVTDSGGTARFVDIDICKASEKGMEYIDSMISLDLDARVIQYQDDFYLLESSYNYYSKHTDSVTLCHLTPQGFGHCVSISQVPASYEHELIYENNQYETEAVTGYVASVMDDVISASPINDEIGLYLGDETLIDDHDKSPRLKSVGQDYDYYEIDFNNDEESEYISRHYWYPSNSLCLFLIPNLYRFTPKRIVELNCELSNGYGELVQVWFKDLENKIFTFRLFAFQDKYLLNVSLTEGSQITQIQTWLIVPQNKFSITSWESGEENDIDYSDSMHMSKAALYEQITSEYSEKFIKTEANYAINHLN